MRQVAFHARAFDQFTDWSARDRKIFDRIVRLITESARTPFTGTGKPKALKHEHVISSRTLFTLQRVKSQHQRSPF